MRMVALEVDGPHTTFRPSNVQDAVLVLSSISSADLAMRSSLGKLLYLIAIDELDAHTAGTCVQFEWKDSVMLLGGKGE